MTPRSKQLTEETLTSPSLLLSSDDSLHAPPLPTLPFDLVAEILCRLPVKFLLQLRCVCKSWDSLISDPKFAKKHLRVSTTRRLFFLSFSEPLRKFLLTSYPLHSVLTTVATNATLLEYPPDNFDGEYPPNHLRYIAGSCDGMLCLADYYGCFVLLWNPSIRKLKELPLMEIPQVLSQTTTVHGFGYDAFTDNYKVVAVTYYPIRYSSDDWFQKTEVKVHTLGTNFWRSIQEFPFGVVPIDDQSGKFVSGRINWLASTDGFSGGSTCVIVSFDLEKESYQEVLQPDYGGAVDTDARNYLTLGVLRDCLCMTFGLDFWVMKEYGNKESWTKLFTIPHMGDPSKYHCITKALYIFEDDQVLLEFAGDYFEKLIVCDSRNGTFKFTEVKDISEVPPEVCVESLISPCS